MKPTKEMLKEYAAIAKKSNRDMKGCIKAHLVANCPKFAGHEDKFDECIEYVTECAKEILKNRPGDVADDACYKMARDFFNDELWDKKPEKAATKGAQADETDVDDEVSVEAENEPAQAPETKPAPKPATDQCSLFDLAGFANA